MRALIIDDEEHAREEMQALLTETGAFDLLGSCRNALEALRMINSHKPDLIFLDIEMPALNGFEMLGMIDEEVMPYVVFITAYDEYALRAFEENTLDYLLKPVSPERLSKMVDKVTRAIHEGKQQNYPVPLLENIPCQTHDRIRLVRPEDVDHVFTDICGVNVITAEGSFNTQLTLKVLEQRTPLIRCHKGYLANHMQIKDIRKLGNGNAEITTRLGKVIPLSRRYLKKLKEKLKP